MPEFDDDLEKLKAALKSAPAPDGPSKEAAFMVAEENFAALQGNDGFTRPTETAPQRGGVLKGLKTMFANISLKPLLLTTSSIVVVGVGFLLMQPNLRFDDATLVPEPVSQATEEEVVVVEPIVEVPVIDDSTFEGRQRDQVAQIAPSQIQPAPAVPQKKQHGVALSGRAEMGVVNPDDSNAGGTQFSTDIDVEFTESGETENGLTFGSSVDLDIGTETPNTDRFANEAPNPLKTTSEAPVSTFSTDVDTASYAWVRRALQNGQLPDRAAVRIEEMVNYFPYSYAAPEGDVPFATTVTVSETPWNKDTQLVHIGIQGELPAVEDRPPLNLVFLIDTSGSMNSADKLPLLIQSFRLMLSELRPQDQVAIVTYAGSAGLVLEPTAASETGKINAALANLSAGGSTAGAAGLQQAYQVADRMAEDGEISRVILATDGDFNVGQSSDAEMKTMIEAKRDSGTYLSVLGFGRGNINDALMQTLAQNGNGQAAYIDTLSEARKVLVDQLTGALFPIAGDVKVQIEWNPAQVAEYRLIGYETRALKREDFNNDKVDAGDIGAGHTVTALYEVTPVGSPAVLNDPLRYGEATAASDSDELGFLRLRYKEPGETQSKLIETPIATTVVDASEDANFATVIAGFGQLLRGSDYLGDWGYTQAIALANTAKGDDAFGYRAEAITLMRLADSLSKAR